MIATTDTLYACAITKKHIDLVKEQLGCLLDVMKEIESHSLLRMKKLSCYQGLTQQITKSQVNRNMAKSLGEQDPTTLSIRSKTVIEDIFYINSVYIPIVES